MMPQNIRRRFRMRMQIDRDLFFFVKHAVQVKRRAVDMLVQVVYPMRETF